MSLSLTGETSVEGFLDSSSKLYPFFSKLCQDSITVRLKNLLPLWLNQDKDELNENLQDELNSLTCIMNLTFKFKTRNMIERDLINAVHIEIQDLIASNVDFEESNLDTYFDYMHYRIKPIFYCIFGENSSMPLQVISLF